MGYRKQKYYDHVDEYDTLYYWAREIRMAFNYKCVCCNTGSKLSAHHIFPKSKYKGLMYNMSNGILLCKKCHKELHRLNDIVAVTTEI